jgi:hypothetical protein
MTAPSAHTSNRKDLQDLRNLSRARILSFLQKQAPPPAPRIKTADLAPARYPILAAFTPKRLCKWIWEYLSHRHPFQVYVASDHDQGIYKRWRGTTRGAMSNKTAEEIEAEKRKMLSLYAAIGQFMFEFSQLEFIIRHALREALALSEIGNDAQFDIVVSPYDFGSLCNVTKAIFMRTTRCEEDDRKEIESIMNACMTLNNEERVPIRISKV